MFNADVLAPATSAAAAPVAPLSSNQQLLLPPGDLRVVPGVAVTAVVGEPMARPALPPRCFVPGSPHVIRIDMRRAALISYQDHHMLSVSSGDEPPSISYQDHHMLFVCAGRWSGPSHGARQPHRTAGDLDDTRARSLLG